MDSQVWYKSRGVYGGFISITASLLAGYGYIISPEDVKALIELFVVVGSGAGGILSIVGRVFAKKLFKQ